MSRARRSRSLQVEALETRRVPAAISTAGGGLTITNPDGPLLVETTATPNQYIITDNLGSQIVTSATRSIIVTGTSGDDILDFDATVSPLFASVWINGLAGTDQVHLGGTFAGNMTINLGAGDDLVTQFADVTVLGDFVVSDLAGANSFSQNDLNLDVARNLSLVGLANYTMGNSTISTLAVGGTVSIAGLGVGSNTTPLNVGLNGKSVSIAGNLFVNGTGHTGSGDVFVCSAELTVLRNIALNLAGGTNTAVVSPTAGGLGVAGTTTFIGGSGVDVVVLGADSLLSKAVTVNLGGGVNTFVDTATSKYGVGLNVVAGEGTDTVVIQGQVIGNLSVDMGGGDGNTCVFTGSASGLFRYRDGTGNLGTLVIAPAVPKTVTVDVLFGRGTKTLNLGPKLTLTGRIVGTGGSYTFNPGTATLLPSLKKILFP